MNDTLPGSTVPVSPISSLAPCVTKFTVWMLPFGCLKISDTNPAVESTLSQSRPLNPLFFIAAAKSTSLGNHIPPA